MNARSRRALDSAIEVAQERHRRNWNATIAEAIREFHAAAEQARLLGDPAGSHLQPRCPNCDRCRNHDGECRTVKE